MGKYSEYCNAFYDEKTGTVYFYDEIEERIMDEQKVSGRVEADMVMRIWQDNAPKEIICGVLNH